MIVTNGLISELIIGDDYLTFNERQLAWTVDKPANFDVSGARTFFGAKIEANQKFVIEGLIDDNGDTLTLTFEINRTVTALLQPGNYDWSVAIHDADGRQITVRTSGTNPVKLSRKFTNS